MISCRTIGWLVGVALSVGLVRADEPANDSVERLVARLDSDSFAVRQNATDALLAMGPTAFPALEKAASGESLEVTNRALDILARQLQSPDDGLRTAAKESLQRLSQGRNALVARRAGDLLQPRADAKNVDVNQLALPVPRVIGNRIVVNRAVAINRPAVQNRVQIVNGVKTSEFHDGDRKVKIVEDPNKGIEIELTEKKDGQETTKKFAAKDVAELKTKHPDGYKLFDQHILGPLQTRADIYKRSVQELERQLENIRNQNLPDVHQKALKETIERLKKQIEDAEALTKKDK